MALEAEEFLHDTKIFNPFADYRNFCNLCFPNIEIQCRAAGRPTQRIRPVIANRTIHISRDSRRIFDHSLCWTAERLPQEGEQRHLMLVRPLVAILLSFFLVVGHAFAGGRDDKIVNNHPDNTWAATIGGLISRPRSVAVVIAISNYTRQTTGYDALPTAQKDAEKMVSFLKDDAGFDTIYVLTDEKVTKDRLDQLMIDEIPKILAKDDRFLFYWSGHGDQFNLGGQPRGFLPLATSTRDAPSSMISMEDLSRWDSFIVARQTLFLLDACLSGLAGVLNPKASRSDRLEQLAQPSHHLIAAGGAKETVISSDRWSGSLFTELFIRGARGEAVRRDGVISEWSLLDFIQDGVLSEKRAVHWDKSLTPQMSFLAAGAGAFFFVSHPYQQQASKQGAEDVSENAEVKGSEPPSFTVSYLADVPFAGPTLLARDIRVALPSGKRMDTFVQASGSTIAVASRDWANPFPPTKFQVFLAHAGELAIDATTPIAYWHEVGASDNLFAVSMKDGRVLLFRRDGDRFLHSGAITADHFFVSGDLVIAFFKGTLSAYAFEGKTATVKFSAKICDEDCQVRSITRSGKFVYVAMNAGNSSAVVRAFQINDKQFTYAYDLSDPSPNPDVSFANQLQSSSNLLVVENMGPVHEAPYELVVHVFKLGLAKPVWLGRVFPIEWHLWKQQYAQTSVVAVGNRLFALINDELKEYDFKRKDWSAVKDQTAWTKDQWRPVTIASAMNKLVVVLERADHSAREARVLHF
jgi:hypothetical protein